jgi:hypothetical protein
MTKDPQHPHPQARPQTNWALTPICRHLSAATISTSQRKSPHAPELERNQVARHGLQPGMDGRRRRSQPGQAVLDRVFRDLRHHTDRHFNHMRPSIAPQNSLRTTGISSQSHSGALVGSAAAKKVLCRRMISIAPGAPDTGTPRRAPASPLWPVTS